MKKPLLFLLLFVFMFLFVGCKEVNTDDDNPTEEKKITVNFYDGDELIFSKEFINEITPIKYTRTDSTFGGWYLDKEYTIPFDEANTGQYFTSESINLYVKMERDMKDFELSIKGLINDNEVALNPVFTWNNSNSDASFKVSLLINNEVVVEKETDDCYYQYDKLLQENKEYEFVLTGSTSKFKTSVKFKTIAKYENTVTKITLANPYDNGMVMQRGVENIIRGTAPINQVMIAEINGERYYGMSDSSGVFEITIPPMEKSFIGTVVKISNGLGVTNTISDVLIGDVYLFAGQSNMQWPTKDSDYQKSDIESLRNSSVRFFCQDVVTSTTKLDKVTNGRWFKPNANNCDYFSAIATMTGAMLGEELKNEAPIGIITAYQGDTNIANWMGSEYYTGTCQTKYLHYNAMVYPLRSARLKGVVWYQGCNNSASGCDYKDLLLKFFANYRDLFENDKLKFYVIGLACYDGDNGNNFDFSYVRESQAKACDEDDNAYFISTCDDGDPTYIHPKAKRYICGRVCKSICASIYYKDYYAEGPSYKSHTVSGNVVTITLNNADGLRSVGKITGLYLAGSDGKYYEADARVSEEKIIASCDKVSNPVYIKYGFGKSPFVNVFNKDNYSLVPFRTDEYNANIDLLDYNSLDNYTFHPDGSKMEIEYDNDSLKIKKTNDGKGYGSVRLDKWGAIIYEPQGFEFTVIGTNSGAAISFRAIEGDSYEIWGYKIIDDFTGEKTFSIGIGDFSVMYNKQNNIFEPQKISYIEIMVEANGEATFEIASAKFVKIERQKPMSFIISTVSEDEENINITLGKSLFADSYELVITTDGKTDPIYTKEQEDLVFNIDKTLFEVGKAYYVKATAKNDLGESDATNSGYVFYLKDENKVIVCNFDFKDQSALDAYIDSSMSVHNGLKCELVDEGVKITSTGQGWQQFIFKLDTGVGEGMTKMQFDADFSHYNGQVILQLADTNWVVYQYTLNLQEKNQGTFIIDFSNFVKDNKPFTTQTLMWLMFNFNDTVGNGYIIFDDLSISK